MPPRREYPLRTRDRREAEQIYLRYRRDFALGTFDPWQDRRPGRQSLDSTIALFLRTKRRQARSTQAAYHSTLGLFEASCQAAAADAIRQADIERFIQAGRRGGGPFTVKTQNNHLQRLSTFFRWCIREGYATTNPALSYWKHLDQQEPRRRKRGKPRRDFLMPPEMQRWCAAVHLDTQGRTLSGGGRLWSRAYVRDMAELACCTGLRESELCNLNRDHIRLRFFETDRGRLALGGQVLVAEYDGVETKTGEERLVPLVPRAALLLERWSRTARDENPAAPVFTGPRLGRRIIPRTLSEHFATYRRQAGLRASLSFHSTRHTFVSWMLMLGLPIYQVRELAGHSGITITEQYAHISRRYLHGQARTVAAQILAFYCPGLEPERIEQALDGGLQGSVLAGGALAGYAWGATALLDVLFGAALYQRQGAEARSVAGDLPE